MMFVIDVLARQNTFRSAYKRPDWYKSVIFAKKSKL